MLDTIISTGIKTAEMVAIEKAVKRGVESAYILKSMVRLDGEELTARLIIHRRSDGTFAYDHAIDAEEAGVMGGSSGTLDSVDSTETSLSVLLPDEPSSGHNPIAILDDAGGNCQWHGL